MTAPTKHPGSISAALAAPMPGAATFRPKVAAAPWEPPPAAEAPAAEPAPEPRVDKRTLAAHFGMSIRWIEQKMQAGMPHEHMDGRARFRIREAETWLKDNGHLREAN